MIMLIVMMPHVKSTNLASMPLEQGLVFSAIPVVFTSSWIMHQEAPYLIARHLYLGAINSGLLVDQNLAFDNQKRSQ
ncbi:hypothetical protein SAMN02982990_02314 [Photorhabdus luminescens]|uniref:Uncharacterized protein n=1 Tax=Photorhabdus luminescens TaxID=29488 RepID=A0A1G5QSX7_PHOLU|nr:hypothetical protein SAMN02982990_02314 [Photorhabdus luminescens]